MGWGIPSTPLVPEQNQGCEDKEVNHRLGAFIYPLLQVPQMLGAGQPELNHINFLYQSPSFANARNFFQSCVGLNALLVLWTGLN